MFRRICTIFRENLANCVFNTLPELDTHTGITGTQFEYWTGVTGCLDKEPRNTMNKQTAATTVIVFYNNL